MGRGRHRRLAPTLVAAALVAALAPALCAVDRRDAFIGYREDKADVAASPCKDSSDNCMDWALRGECDSNAGFMRTSCAAACNACPPPAVGEASELPTDWTGDVIELSTRAGAIRIALLADGAPKTTSLVKRLATEEGSSCRSCRFYRSEALPKPGAVDNYGGPGPPYALIQGSFDSAVFASERVEKERAPLVKRGDACLIGAPGIFGGAHPHAAPCGRDRARLFYRCRPTRGVGQRAHRVGPRCWKHGCCRRYCCAASEGRNLGSHARHSTA